MVQRLLADWERSLEDVHNLFALRRGKLDIAAMPTFASSLLPSILAEYRQLYTGINITIHDVIAESVVDMVRDERVELGVTFDPGDALDLDFQPLFRDKFVAVLPADHPLLGKRRLTWQDLKNFPLYHPATTIQHPLVDRQDIAGQRHGADSRTFEAHQLASIGRMVTTGLGISVVPALSGDQMREMGAECRPVTAPLITRQVGVITRKRHSLSVAAQAMLQVITHWALASRLSPPSPAPSP